MMTEAGLAFRGVMSSRGVTSARRKLRAGWEMFWGVPGPALPCGLLGPGLGSVIRAWASSWLISCMETYNHECPCLAYDSQNLRRDCSHSVMKAPANDSQGKGTFALVCSS